MYLMVDLPRATGSDFFGRRHTSESDRESQPKGNAFTR